MYGDHIGTSVGPIESALPSSKPLISLRQAQEMVRLFHARNKFAEDLLPRMERAGSCSMMEKWGPLWNEIGLHRAHLINEELGELLQAWANRDIVEIADGLADLLYVVLGTAVAAGIDIEPIFQEVHASNMTKDPAGTSGKIHPHKGENFKAPQIAALLRLQGFKLSESK